MDRAKVSRINAMLAHTKDRNFVEVAREICEIIGPTVANLRECLFDNYDALSGLPIEDRKHIGMIRLFVYQEYIYQGDLGATVELAWSFISDDATLRCDMGVIGDPYDTISAVDLFEQLAKKGSLSAIAQLIRMHIDPLRHKYYDDCKYCDMRLRKYINIAARVLKYDGCIFAIQMDSANARDVSDAISICKMLIDRADCADDTKIAQAAAKFVSKMSR